MFAYENSKGQTVIVGRNLKTNNLQVVTSGADGTVAGGWSVADVTDAITAAYPGDVVQLDWKVSHMKLPTNMALMAFGLAAIGLIGAIVLAGMSKTIPPNLWTVTLAALAGGAGIAIPTTAPVSNPSAAETTPPVQNLWMTDPVQDIIAAGVLLTAIYGILNNRENKKSTAKITEVVIPKLDEVHEIVRNGSDTDKSPAP
jgi:hypothetical protein